MLLLQQAIGVITVNFIFFLVEPVNGVKIFYTCSATRTMGDLFIQQFSYHTITISLSHRKIEIINCPIERPMSNVICMNSMQEIKVLHLFKLCRCWKKKLPLQIISISSFLSLSHTNTIVKSIFL